MKTAGWCITLITGVLIVSGSVAQNVTDYGVEVKVVSPVEFPRPGLDMSKAEDTNFVQLYSSLEMSQSEPVWSPDGQLIAFSTSSGIFTVPVTGGEAQLVYALYYEHELGTFIIGARAQNLCFTPDGKEILFHESVFDTSRGGNVEISRNEHGGFNVSAHSATLDIVGVSLDTGEKRIIVENAMNPSLSYDGRYLCYNDLMEHHTIGNVIITVLDLKTGESWPVTDTIKAFSGPSISADNSHVIFDIWDEENNESKFFTVPLHGGAVQPLNINFPSPAEGLKVGFPRYSPDGSLILYNDVSSKPYTLSLIDVRSGDSFGVFESNTCDIYKAQWSPDGTKICYQITNSEGRERIYIKEIDTAVANYQASVELTEPADFAILGNYPNPFNPATTIEFSLPEAGFVGLVIYNVMGQKVRELLAGSMTPGVHTVTWDGRDDRGLLVSTGVYVTRLRMNETEVSGRMTLVK